MFFKYTHILSTPLGLSFFTFQQLWFLIEVWRGHVGTTNILDYSIFSLFFPTVSSGPILRHDKLLPQLNSIQHSTWEDKSSGLYAIAVGLGKKVILADSLGVMVANGYTNVSVLGSHTAIMVILGYTLQLYFDFSGYCDMASGIALMFGFKIPKNFNSPYRAISITDFWKRWHITLTDFLRECVYFPLGGSRKGHIRTLINILIVYLISGIWHGTGWTFLFWGALHALAMIAERLLKKPLEYIPNAIRWILTFAYINIAWIFFRSESLVQGFELLCAVFRPTLVSGSSLFSGVLSTEISVLTNLFSFLYNKTGLLLAAVLLGGGTIIVLWPQNLQNKLENFRPTLWKSIVTVVLIIWSVLSFSGISTFIYSNF